MTDNDLSLARSRQNTVDAMRSLINGYSLPREYRTVDSARLEGWFDVNAYFSVLSHLSMQPGYTLDYVYHGRQYEGHPYMYARRVDSKPFSSLKELTQSSNTDMLKNPYSRPGDYDYLSYIQTDNTKESFFQYAVLRILGGNFYLYWHDNYRKCTIICDHIGLEALFCDTGILRDGNLPFKIQEEARQLELAPRVEFTEDTAVVRLVTFTKWGGFNEGTYTITRTFPHIITDIKIENLVSWDCGILY